MSDNLKINESKNSIFQIQKNVTFNSNNFLLISHDEKDKLKGNNPPPQPENNSPEYWQNFYLIDTNLVTANGDTNLLEQIEKGFPSNNFSGRDIRIHYVNSQTNLFELNNLDPLKKYVFMASEQLSSNPAVMQVKPFLNYTNNPANGNWKALSYINPANQTEYAMVIHDPEQKKGFYLRIPYEGPEIKILNYQPYASVSNQVNLEVEIKDLPVMNQHCLAVEVNGNLEAIKNTGIPVISFNSQKYPNGTNSVIVKVANEGFLSSDGENRKSFVNAISIPLIFNNKTWLEYADQFTTPEVLNYYPYSLVYVYGEAEAVKKQVNFYLKQLDGSLIRSFGGIISGPAFVEINWDMRNSSGEIFTNDQYICEYISRSLSAPSTNRITTTNMIDSTPVRVGTKLLVHEEEPPWPIYSWIESQALTDFTTMNYLYQSLYIQWPWGPGYTTYDIGSGRNLPIWPPVQYFHWTKANETNAPVQLRQMIVDKKYDSFLWDGHGNISVMGGGIFPFPINRYILTKLHSYDVREDLRNFQYVPPKDRYRQVEFFGCFMGSDTPDHESDWFPAFGILPTAQQFQNACYKNVGLGFDEKVKAYYFWSDFYATQAEVALQDSWTQFSNVIIHNPTIPYGYVFQVVAGMYPKMNKWEPKIMGFYLLPYEATHELNMALGDYSHITQY